jgi:hypothetical protein
MAAFHALEAGIFPIGVAGILQVERQAAEFETLPADAGGDDI